MKANEKAFNNISNIPLTYARFKLEDYGKRGKKYTFYCTNELYNLL